jgi:cell division protein FtsB
MPESISVVRILVPTATVIVLGVLFFLVLLLQEASADNDILRSQLISTEQLLQKQTAENQAITAKTSELKAKISEAESTGGSLTTALDTIERQSQAIDRIGIIISKLTPDISLIDANFAENTYTLNGISSGEKEVLSFLEELDTSSQFSEVIAVRMNNLEGGGVAFTAFLSTEE